MVSDVAVEQREPAISPAAALRAPPSRRVMASDSRKIRLPGFEMSPEAKLQATSKTKPPNVEDRLTRLFKRESEVINEARRTLGVLKGFMTRVKTDGVKDSVDKLIGLFDVLVRCRNGIKSEYRSMVVSERTRAELIAVDTKIFDRVVASKVTILDTLGAMSKRIDNQDTLINNLSSETHSRKTGEDLVARPDTDIRWTEVVKKSRRAVVKSTTVSRSRETAKLTTTTPRSRPLAVIVNRGDAQFPELLKTVRSKVDPGITETAISKIRQTKTGSLLIQINGGAEAAKIVKD